MPKRKRTPASASTEDAKEPSNQDAINAIFRANFEARFGRIDVAPVIPASVDDSAAAAAGSLKKRRRKDDVSSNEEEEDDDEDEDDDDDDEEDDDDDQNDETTTATTTTAPEIISYDFSRRGPPPTTKPSPRTFMSSKPPLSSLNTPAKSQSSQQSSKLSKTEAATEALNLKNDIALHTLLTESHLLDHKTLTHSTPKNRHKAIESRIVSLGGNPLKSGGNIPIAIQKGMKAKQRLKEEKFKREAKENGIVVDKESKRAKERRKNKERQERRRGEGRDAGVGHAKVGKFRGGELRLSRRDVAAMRV
ncbi:hypothetical protein TWF730_001531 [Orbilia blumenaviensis]|uniref:Uncharacterized protein n=1 Tax=Orbilia blumenaviensis TaxID=1796055 RepID=A0AAV9UL25_9PEZI